LAGVSVGDLRIGWFDTDGAFQPAPAVRRAVHQAREILEGAGATVTEFDPPDLERAVRLYFGDPEF
jgi:Asp-tRNA(Asn)/Glu-tRNA(Gln) amidotransferase A subunit family amidase